MIALKLLIIFFFKKKTADEMRISDWSSDVGSSDLPTGQKACPHPMSEAQHPPRSVQRLHDRQESSSGCHTAAFWRFDCHRSCSRHRRWLSEIGRASCSV